jgi:hypothetical protein
LAKMALLAAALLLAPAIWLMAAAPAQSATDCKSAWGNAACSKSAKLNIAPAPPPKPAPKPRTASQSRTIAKPPAAAAKPQTAPRLAARPAPHRQALAKRPLSHRAARSLPHRYAYTENRRARYRRSLQEWKAHGERQTVSRDDYRPHSGPVYESGPGYAAGAPPIGAGCDADCQYRDRQYRDWFVRYSAWYDRYGRSTGATPPQPANRYYGPAGPDAAYSGSLRPDQSERDRQDPWHGYNPRDGLGNGY